MHRLWLASGIALVVAAISVVLWANSDAIDCYPSCSWDQTFFAYLMTASAAVFVALTVAAIVVSLLRWRARR